MQYLLLVHIDEAKAAAASAEQVATVMAGVAAISEELTREGRKIGLARLEPSATTRTLRVKGGRHDVTDGPFVETKEQLGGFWIVEAADDDQAVEIARRLPLTDYTTVEVRPVASLDLASLTRV